MKILLTDYGFNFLKLYPEGSRIRKRTIHNFNKFLKLCFKTNPPEKILFYTADIKNNPIYDLIIEISKTLKIAPILFSDHKLFDKEAGKAFKNSDISIYSGNSWFGGSTEKAINKYKPSSFNIFSDLADLPIHTSFSQFDHLTKLLKNILDVIPKDELDADGNPQPTQYYEGEVALPEKLVNYFNNQFGLIKESTSNVYFIYSENELLFDLFSEMFIKEFRIKEYLIVNHNQEQSLLSNAAMVIQKNFCQRSAMRQTEILDLSFRSNNITFIHINDKSTLSKTAPNAQIQTISLPNFNEIKKYLTTFLYVYLQRINNADISEPATFDIVYNNLYNPLLDKIKSLDELALILSKITIDFSSSLANPVFWLLFDQLYNNLAEMEHEPVKTGNANLWRCRGSVWETNLGWEDSLLINDYLGMYYLAELLDNPDKEYDTNNLRVSITHKTIIDRYKKQHKGEITSNIDLTINSIKKSINTVIQELEKRESQFSLSPSLASHINNSIDYSNSNITYRPGKEPVFWNYISKAKTLEDLPVRKNKS